jgi:hypothetical protein
MIKKNSLIKDGNILKPGQMSFAPSGAASFRVQKREFISNITSPTSPTSFHQQQFRLQSTDKKSFPWLAAIAERFSEWELHGAIFSYESTSSNYAAGMALGTIALATQYNANELPYDNMEAILQAAYHSRANPSEDLMHGIECDPSLQISEKLFTRRFGTAGPPNLYDHGVVTIATEGLPADAGTIIGRLFVTYDIELNLPCLPTGGHHIGDSALLWRGAFQTTEPPMGATLDLIDYPERGISFGPSPGVNIMSLQPSNGPWSRPQLLPADLALLVGWMSDSSSTAGLQYLSFANPGTYMLELTLCGDLSMPGSDAVDVAAVSADVTFKHTPVPYPSLLTGLVTFFIVTITTESADQTISLQRGNAIGYKTWSVLSICA